jgi:hypothetical protein
MNENVETFFHAQKHFDEVAEPEKSAIKQFGRLT